MRQPGYSRALQLHAEARAISEALGDRACGNLGVCYNRTGKYAQALELHVLLGTAGMGAGRGGAGQGARAWRTASAVAATLPRARPLLRRAARTRRCAARSGPRCRSRREARPPPLLAARCASSSTRCCLTTAW